MKDIVERLRDAADVWRDKRHGAFLREAADEIEQLRKWWKRELNSCVEANKEIERLRGKLARLERDWDLRADAIRRTQKLHRAELKQARARWAGGAKTEGV